MVLLFEWQVIAPFARLLCKRHGVGFRYRSDGVPDVCTPRWFIKENIGAKSSFLTSIEKRDQSSSGGSGYRNLPLLKRKNRPVIFTQPLNIIFRPKTKISFCPPIICLLIVRCPSGQVERSCFHRHVRFGAWLVGAFDHTAIDAQSRTRGC